MTPSEEQAIFISILENQRNVAMTELARAAARIAVLETALAQQPKEARENNDAP